MNKSDSQKLANLLETARSNGNTIYWSTDAKAPMMILYGRNTDHAILLSHRYDNDPAIQRAGIYNAIIANKYYIDKLSYSMRVYLLNVGGTVALFLLTLLDGICDTDANHVLLLLTLLILNFLCDEYLRNHMKHMYYMQDSKVIKIIGKPLQIRYLRTLRQLKDTNTLFFTKRIKRLKKHP